MSLKRAKGSKARVRSPSPPPAASEDDPVEHGRHFIEDYIDTMRTLPMSVRLKLQRLGDLDKKTADAAASLDADTEALVSSLDSADAGTQRSMADRRRALMAQYDDVLKAADEKIAIAQSVYDLTDAHLLRLELDISRVEHSRVEMDDAYHSVVSIAKRGSGKNRKSDAAFPAKRPRGDEIDVSATSAVLLAAVADVTVDENEPRYCVCNQVSYGSMIACDNSTCEKEWFHYPCVGLTTPPAGKWYCPDCKNKKKSK